MPIYKYTARDKAGQKVSGTVDAADRRLALTQIERMGHIPVTVDQQTGPAPKAVKQKGFRLQQSGEPRMSGRDLLMFTTELSDLLASGMTLGNALNTLSNRKSGRPADLILPAVRDDILKGLSLSDALAKHPKTFKNLYVSMVKAGEAAGALESVLARLVTHYERIQETREKVTMALTYPAIVVGFGSLTIVFTMVKIVPKFQTIFDGIGQALPLPTRILIGTSNFFIHYGLLMAVAIGLIAVSMTRAVQTTAKGRHTWDAFLLKAPLVKGIVASSTFSNLARTLATLLSNGVPALQALANAEKTVSNSIISGALATARARVTDGTTISGPLAASGIFPAMMTDMLAVGEQTGDMAKALEHIAKRYEGELDRNLKVMVTALEPIMIVGVAIMVAFVAVSILLAVFSMTDGLSQ